MDTSLSAPESNPISGGCEIPLPNARYRPRPSERNLQVYEAVRMRGRTQAEIGAELGLSQRRVSQICQQVEIWRTTSEPALVHRPSAGDRARIERQLLRRQLEQLYAHALGASDRSREPMVIEKRGDRNGREWSEITRRELPPNPQWLKLAMRSAELLAVLGDVPHPSEIDDPAIAQIMARARTLLGDVNDLATAERQSGGADKSSFRSSKTNDEIRSLQGVPAAFTANASPGGVTGCGEPLGGESRPESPSSDREKKRDR